MYNRSTWNIKNKIIMANTNYSMVFKSKLTGNVLTQDLTGEMTYKTAVAIAVNLCNNTEVVEENGLICVIETKKLYPGVKKEENTKEV